MNGGTLKTDTEIASKNKTNQQRDLVKWNAGSDDESLQCTLNDTSTNNPYVYVTDLSKLSGSQSLYGLSDLPSSHVSSYDENLYTTQLDISSIPKEVQERALKIAREIQEAQRDSHSEGSVDETDVSLIVANGSDGQFGSTLGSGLSPLDNASINSDILEFTNKSQLLPPAPPSSPLKEQNLETHNQN